MDDEEDSMAPSLPIPIEIQGDSSSLEIFLGANPQLSLNALVGMPTLETFQVYGLINHHRVTILVDKESTHTFIQSHVATFLDLPSSSTHHYMSWSVKVAL